MSEEDSPMWTCSNCKKDNTTIVCCEFCFYPKFHQPKECVAGTNTGWSCFKCQSINNYMTFYCKNCFMPRHSPLKSHTKMEKYSDDERRLILIGKTGSGKSATGNSILDKEVFESRISNSSVTQKCQRSTTSLFGKFIQIVDTPGLFDTGMDNEQVTMEILKCAGISAPGPHAFLLTLSIGRFTEEEISTLDLLCNIFGQEMKNHLIVIFTRKDALLNSKKTIDDLVASAPPYLQNLIKECGHRYIAWSNIASKEEKKSQTEQLLQIIETLLKQNGGTYFHSQIFKETDDIVKEREEEIRESYEHNHFKRLMQFRRQISQEYQQKLKLCLERENDLGNQIRILQGKQEQVTKDIHGDLNKLCDELSMPSDTSEYDDSNGSQILQNLLEKIQEIEIKLKENRKQQVLLYEGHETESLNKEHEWEIIYTNFQPRDNVRKEIEDGREGIIIRFWGRLRHGGQRITDGFIAIFKYFKNKPNTT